MKQYEDDSTIKLVALQCETLSAKIIRLPCSVYDDMVNVSTKLKPTFIDGLFEQRGP